MIRLFLTLALLSQFGTQAIASGPGDIVLEGLTVSGGEVADDGSFHVRFLTSTVPPPIPTCSNSIFQVLQNSVVVQVSCNTPVMGIAWSRNGKEEGVQMASTSIRPEDQLFLYTYLLPGDNVFSVRGVAAGRNTVSVEK